MRISLVAFALTFMLMTASAQHNSAELKFLALGDSYTIGESVSEAARWPNQLADTLRKKGVRIAKPEIIATTGWRTDDLQNAIREAHPASDYGMVSLLIGVNNQYQGKPIAQFKKEFGELLTTSVRLAGGKKEHVFVVSIPDYGFTPFGAAKKEKISAELDEYNSISKKMAAAAGIKYVPITDISREAGAHPDLIASDHLHPSEKMYSRWAERISKALGY